jgi:hypothetical protein
MTHKDELKAGVPVMRVFKARAVAGKEAELAEKLATTSVGVVSGKAGFVGHLAGQPAETTGSDFVFITLWKDFSALKAVFGDRWRESFLPPGYAEIIEQHSIEHYELAAARRL